MGPASGGGITVLQILGMVERFPLSAWGKDDPRSWHVIGEAMQLAYADRGTWLGDPDFVAVPISGQFGAQVDGILADYSASDTYGIGLHGFWRDPEIGLAGIVVSHTDIGGTDINRYAAEGEYYLNNLTFAGTAGYQTGDSLETGFGAADIRWYATDDLMVEIGASAISSARVGHIGVEWKAPVRFAGVSLFADGAIGTDSYDHVIGGIRIYFGGGDKSLKRRHREDDPINSLVTGVTSAVSGVAGAAAAAGSSSSGGLGGAGGGGGGV